MSHTPGAWRYLPDFGEVVTDDVDYLILVKLNDAVEISDEQYHANGRLIAAAPDLLSALKGALDFIHETCGEELAEAEDVAYTYTAARALVAKAEGTDS